MRGLERNMRDFWYSNVIGSIPVVDEQGFETGETEIKYSDPIRVRGSISPPYGSASHEMFGIDVPYEMVITMFLPSPDFSEDSVLWIGYSPSERPKHTHIIKSISESLNIVQIAVARVDVT
jgi:hypothetical protein